MMKRYFVILVCIAASAVNAQWVLVSPNANGGYVNPTGSFTFPSYTTSWEKLGGNYRSPTAAFLRIQVQFAPTYSWASSTSLPPSKVFVYESGRLYTRGYWYPTLTASIPFEKGRTEGSNVFGELEVWGHRYSQINTSGNSFTLPSVAFTTFGADSTASSSGCIRSDGEYSPVIMPHYWIKTEGTDTEPNYRREGPGDPTPANPNRVQNLRDRDQYVSLDVATYYDQMQGKWRGVVCLDGRYSFWADPRYQVIYTGSANPTMFTQMDIDDNEPRLILETLSSASETANQLGSTSTVRMAVTSSSDPESPSLLNKIDIRWHKPNENFRTFLPRRVLWAESSLNLATPGYAIYGGAIMAYWTEGGAWLYTGTEIGTAVGVGSTLTSAMWPGFGALFSIVGVTLQNAIPTPNQNSVPFNWGAPEATYFPYRDDTRKAYYIMRPQLLLGYDVDAAKSDSYDTDGYAGPGYHVVEKFNYGRKFVQNFYLQGTGGGGGGVGGK